MILLDGVSEVEGLGVQIIKRSVPEDDRNEEKMRYINCSKYNNRG